MLWVWKMHYKVISRHCGMEWPTSFRATCPSLILSTAIHSSPTTLHLWERPTSVVGNTKRMWKTTTRNGWKNRFRTWLPKQWLHFNQERYFLLYSLLSFAGAMIPPPPQPSRSSLPKYNASTPYGSSPMMPVMGLFFMGWCQWDLLLEWSHPWEATYQWWGLLPVPWWCLLGLEWLDQMVKDSAEALYIRFILLVLLH